MVFDSCHDRAGGTVHAIRIIRSNHRLQWFVHDFLEHIDEFDELSVAAQARRRVLVAGLFGQCDEQSRILACGGYIFLSGAGMQYRIGLQRLVGDTRYYSGGRAHYADGPHGAVHRLQWLLQRVVEYVDGIDELHAARTGRCRILDDHTQRHHNQQSYHRECGRNPFLSRQGL